MAHLYLYMGHVILPSVTAPCGGACKVPTCKDEAHLCCWQAVWRRPACHRSLLGLNGCAGAVPEGAPLACMPA